MDASATFKPGEFYSAYEDLDEMDTPGDSEYEENRLLSRK